MRSFFQNFTFTFLAKTQYVFLTPSLVTTSTGLKSFFSKECANASAVSNLPDGNCTDLFFASRHTQGCPCASILSISAISRNPPSKTYTSFGILFRSHSSTKSPAKSNWVLCPSQFFSYSLTSALYSSHTSALASGAGLVVSKYNFCSGKKPRWQSSMPKGTTIVALTKEETTSFCPKQK